MATGSRIIAANRAIFILKVAPNGAYMALLREGVMINLEYNGISAPGTCEIFGVIRGL